MEVDGKELNITSGDVICFEVDSLGMLAIPSLNEPLPEHDEPVTHLRVVPFSRVSDVNFCRSMFRIELESGQKHEIKYGSIVRLVHIPSNMVLVGSGIADPHHTDPSTKIYPVQLRSSVSEDLELAQRWVVLPRFKYREEGHALMAQDHILLRSIEYPHLSISSVENINSPINENLAALIDIDSAMKKPCLKVLRVLPSACPQTAAQSSGSQFLFGNDFLRLLHVEFNGHMICRVDDEEEVQSIVAPLGSVCRKQMAEKDKTHAVFVRSLTMQQPKQQYDFFASASSTGIWQIIIDGSSPTSLQTQLTAGSSFRLRHLISGQYLAVRPVNDSDPQAVKNNFYEQDLLSLPKSPNLRMNHLHSQVSRARTRERDLSDARAAHEETEQQSINEDIEGAEDEDDDSCFDSVRNRAQDLSSSTSRFKIKVLSIRAANLKNVEWFGRSNPFVRATFGKHMRAETLASENVNKQASWSVSASTLSDDFVFETDLESLKHESLVLTAIAKHNVLQDTIIGSGSSSIVSHFRGLENYARFDVQVKLLDKMSREVGVLTIDMIAEKINDKVDGTAGGGIIDSLTEKVSKRSGSTKPSAHASQSLFLQVPEEGAESAPATRKFVVATSTKPTAETLFRVHLVDSPGSKAAVRAEDNIILESVKYHFALNLVDSISPGNKGTGQYSKWWEYRQDAPLRPCPLHNSIVGLNIFRFSAVDQLEIQDTIYASRMIPLIRAATATLQLTPTTSQLYSPLFRHFRTAMNTLAIWTIGMTECDGRLLNDSFDVSDGASTSGEFHVASDRQVDDSDDEHDDKTGKTAKRPIPSHRNNREFMKKDSTRHNDTNNQVKSSSYSPWLGRRVMFSQRDQFTVSHLEDSVGNIVRNLQDKPVAMNATIMRRQLLLLDLKIIEQMMHFLNAFFILQRCIANTQDSGILEDYPNTPKLIERCCLATQNLLHICVFGNEKTAIKILSVHGSFLALISQKVLGWNPPIETIMKVACETVENTSNASAASSSKATNLARTDVGAMSEVEEVLMNSITSNDLRQILEQMQEMFWNDHAGAENILNLLRLLCQSGKAKQYFQNILVKLLVTCKPEVTDFTPGGAFSSGESFDRYHRSLLFLTREDSDSQSWQVQFRSPYSLPSQDARSLHSYSKELVREAKCLKQLFDTYNVNGVAEELLDLEECFCLLEDLGFGGPFIYEEIGYLMGSSVWGFMNWWCRRASFFYPSTSVSQSQVSPIHVMQLLGRKVEKLDIEAELNRGHINRDTIVQSLRFQGIISSRIPAFKLMFGSASTFASLSSSAKLSSFGNSRCRYYDDDSISEESQLLESSNVADRSSSLVNKRNRQFQSITSEWIDVKDALSKDYKFNSWFRSSLRLLEALCWGKNVFCQRVISVLVPAEMLLSSLRNSSLSFEDRHIICDAMRTIFVNQDFVFPMRALSTNMPQSFCGADEELHNPQISVGKVFSPLSRVKYANDGFSDGTTLRAQLFDFLAMEMASIRLYSGNKERMRYSDSILKLYLDLLRVGFFGEYQFGFFGKYARSGSSVWNTVFSRKEPVALIANYQQLEYALLEKLQQAISSHGHPEDLDEDSMPKDKSLTFAENMITVAAAAATAAAGGGSFEGIEDKLKSFDELFQDLLYNSIVDTVINILCELQNMAQIMRVQSIWNVCPEVIDKCSLTAYCSDLRELSVSGDSSRLAKVVAECFGAPNAEEEDQYVEAVFTATLHSDSQLQRRCYQLLDRRLNLPLRVGSLLDSTSFFRNSHHAFLHRLVRTYALQLSKHASDIVFSEHFLRPHLFQLMDFTIENIQGLLMDSFLDSINVPTVSSKQLGKGQLDRFDSDRKKVLKFYLSSSDIPCPIGEDDFFFLDIKSVKADTDQMRDLCLRFSLPRQLLLKEFPSSVLLSLDVNNAFGWKIDATDTLSEMTMSIIKVLQWQAVNENIHTWNDLSVTMQLLHEKVFGALAIFVDQSPRFATVIFEQAMSWVLRYYLASSGASRLIHLLVKTVHFSVVIEESVTTLLLERLQALSVKEKRTTGRQLILALLESKCEALFAIAVDVMDSDFASFFDVKVANSWLTSLEQLQSVEDVRKFNNELLVAMKPLFLLLRNHSIHFSSGAFTVFQSICSIEFCVSCLESDVTSLEIKAMIYVIAVKLYELRYLSGSESPFISGVFEDLILRELRLLRKLSTINKMNIDSGQMTVDADGIECFSQMQSLSDEDIFQHFVFDGVLLGIKNRILETTALSMSNVNGFIFTEIASLESKLVNKAVAREVISSIKTDIDVMMRVAASANTVHPSNIMASLDDYDDIEGSTDGDTRRHHGHHHPVRHHAHPQPLSASCISSLMTIFNMLAANDAELYRRLRKDQSTLLLWVASSLTLMITTRSDYLFDFEKNRPIVQSDYDQVRLRLHELLQGILLDRISLETEHFLKEFYQDDVRAACKSKLRSVASDSMAENAYEFRSFEDGNHSGTRETAESSSLISAIPFLFSKLESERKGFRRQMSIAMQFSESFLVSTAHFRFLVKSLTASSKFISLDGMLIFNDITSPIVRSKGYYQRFNSYSVFDIWNKGNGRYLSNLFQYLSTVTAPTSTDYNLIHLLCSLTNNKIDAIRSSQFMSLSRKLLLVKEETHKLHRTQETMHMLGALDTVVKILGRSYSIQTDEYSLFFAPLILKLGSELVAWKNKLLQDAFVDLVEQSFANQKPPELDCVNGLQYLIRKYSSDALALPAFSGLGSTTKTSNLEPSNSSPTATGGNRDSLREAVDDRNNPSLSATRAGQSRLPTGSVRSNDSKRIYTERHWFILRASCQLFSFLGGLCQGDNRKTQRFLAGIYSDADDASAGDGKSPTAAMVNSSRSVALSKEAATLAGSMTSRLIDSLIFLENSQFYDKLAPFVNVNKDNSKRRFLAWHKYTDTLPLMLGYINTVAVAFDNCISLCCTDSVSGLLSAFAKAPQLLDFLGLMQLNAAQKITTSSLTGNSIWSSLQTNRTVNWKGGDPFRFLASYVREMTSLGFAKGDHEFELICRTVLQWGKLSGLSSANSSGASAVWVINQLSAKRDFKSIFGISYHLFLDAVRRAEYSCLRVILSCLEFTSSEDSQLILSSFSDATLIQNVGNLYRKIRLVSSNVQETIIPTAVSYISLIEAIALVTPETRLLFDQWNEQRNEQMSSFGSDHGSNYGCVEIIGSDGRLRRLYFPVPSFVTTFWKYPEVQRVKNAIVIEVVRSSPEEKIADFLFQMNRLSKVMKRQERLKNILTYPLHAIFGGKSFQFMERLPNQRLLCLIITFGLNVYFVYYSTPPLTPPLLLGYLNWPDWTVRDIVVRSVQWAHFLLLGSFALRSVINSDALDHIGGDNDDGDANLKLLDSRDYSPMWEAAKSLVRTAVSIPKATYLLAEDCGWCLALVALSFFAMTWNYWLYVPLLADVIFQFDAMYFLYLAIARNVTRVGFTLLLAFLCLYFYAIVTFLFIGNQFQLNGKSDCTDPASCFKLHMDYGLSNAPEWNSDGFISPFFGNMFQSAFEYSVIAADLLGTVYNISYVILINLVLQAIISGLIIDSFSSMREEKETVLADIADKCFICSIPRDSFERKGVSFHTHILQEHHMWHYLWFKIYLELKDPMSYSSTENYAFKCMQDSQTFVKLIPINHSITLEQAMDPSEAEAEEGEEIARLEGIIQRLQESQAQLSSSLEASVRQQKTIEELLSKTSKTSKISKTGGGR